MGAVTCAWWSQPAHPKPAKKNTHTHIQSAARDFFGVLYIAYTIHVHIYFMTGCVHSRLNLFFSLFFARGNNWVNGFRLWLVWQCLSNWLGYIQLMDIMDVIGSKQICLLPIANVVRLKRGIQEDWRQKYENLWK